MEGSCSVIEGQDEGREAESDSARRDSTPPGATCPMGDPLAARPVSRTWVRSALEFAHRFPENINAHGLGLGAAITRPT